MPHPTSIREEDEDDFVDAEDDVDGSSGVGSASTFINSNSCRWSSIRTTQHLNGDDRNNHNEENVDYKISNHIQEKLLSDEHVDRELTEDLLLHQAIFEHRSVEYISELLHNWKKNSYKSYLDIVSVKDMHGNTPLHLAIMFGLKGLFYNFFYLELKFILVIHVANILFSDIIFLLLTHDAPIKSRNLQGWTPLDESISYGDRSISNFDYCL